MLYKLLRHFAKIKQLHITYLYYTNLYMRIFCKILKNSYPCFFLKFLYPNMSLNNFSNGTPLFWLYIFKTYAFCLFIHLISVCTCVCVCICLLQAWVWRCEDNEEDLFSPSILWALRIKHRLSGLVECTFIFWVISLAQLSKHDFTHSFN